MPENKSLIAYNTFRLLCLRNANDHLKAARLLQGQNVNHLIVHLSVLALEETGKIFMTFIKFTQHEKWETMPLKVPLDDHIKKIFYSIWSPSIGHELIDREQWESNQKMAVQMHNLRLKTLYGDLDDITSSAEKVDDQTAKQILSFAEARVKLAEVEGEVDVNSIINDDFVWFDKMAETKENHSFFFGKKAQNKLIELDDVNEWLKWLKKTKEEENKLSLDLGIREIKRLAPENSEDIKPKWEITFTIYSRSHSIKTSVLSSYKKLDRFPVELFLGKDKHTLIVKIPLGNNIMVNELFGFGFHLCKIYVAALNIATNGIFYWNLRLDHTKFYDKIYDLETSKNLEVRLEDKQINWREKKQYLTEQNLIVSHIVYEYLLTITIREDAIAINEYLEAFSMFAKSDIHLNLENIAYNHFYNAYKTSVIANQKDAKDENFALIGFAEIEKILSEDDSYNQTLELAQSLETATVMAQEISQKELIKMKSICEKYFLTLACRRQTKNPELRLTFS